MHLPSDVASCNGYASSTTTQYRSVHDSLNANRSIARLSTFAHLMYGSISRVSIFSPAHHRTHRNGTGVFPAKFASSVHVNASKQASKQAKHPSILLRSTLILWRISCVAISTSAQLARHQRQSTTSDFSLAQHVYPCNSCGSCNTVCSRRQHSQRTYRIKYCTE